MSDKKSTCLRCHRGLRNPKSVERNMGPVCAVKGQAEKEDGQTQLLPPRYQGTISLNDLPKNTDKVYLFKRDPNGDTITVLTDGRSYPLKHIVHHSPTGMNWGYGGSGAADCARSILVDLAGIKVADPFYQQFKWEMIASAGVTADGEDPEFVIEGPYILFWLRNTVVKQEEPLEALPMY